MDRQVLDAMRFLQSGQVGPEVFAEVRKLVGALRARRVLDATATAEILALLQQWAAAADPALRLEALRWGERLTDDEATKCLLLRQVGDTLLGNFGDVDGAITAYEQALDAEVELELMVDLGNLYVQRGSDGDAEQAAALYAALGEFLGDEDGIEFLQQALDLAPGQTDALDMLEELIPEAERVARLGDRYRAYLASGEDEERRARCTMALAADKAGQGLLEDALEMLDPLVKAGNDGARTLRHDLILAADAHSPASRPPKVAESLPAVATAPVVAAAASPGAERGDATEVDALPPAFDGALPPALADPADVEDLLDDEGRDDDHFENAATAVLQHPAPQLTSDPPPPATPSAPPRPTARVHSTRAIQAADPTMIVRHPRRRRSGWGWIAAALAILIGSVTGGLWVLEQRRARQAEDAAAQAAAAAAVTAPQPAPAPPAPPAAPPPAPPAPEPEPEPTADAATAEAPNEAAEADGPQAEEPTEAPAAPQRTDILVRAAMEHARLRGGKLDRAGVEASLAGITGALQACYDEAIARRPRLRGRLVMQWNVRRTGEVSGLRKVRSSLQDARLHRCAKDAIASVTFDEPRRRPAKLRVPFDFTQPRGGDR